MATTVYLLGDHPLCALHRHRVIRCGEEFDPRHHLDEPARLGRCFKRLRIHAQRMPRDGADFAVSGWPGHQGSGHVPAAADDHQCA
ncbi:hypothetical protein AWL63_23080 (plasmid) [Sphingomonas panacis]|uniref:Uncharacterized protein n=1 Tax=Sphingomonas panacis TaxID=1560345 RepID=A0A1B3ZI26_9SPHN|nr:hypothetical protein AWL63_23080 [Sphingomonas panacis]